jgi:hypothetical protein
MLTALIILIILIIILVLQLLLIWWSNRRLPAGKGDATFEMEDSFRRLTMEYKRRVWLALGVLLFLAWAISYFVVYAGVLIHLLLIFALTSFVIHVFIGKRRGE